MQAGTTQPFRTALVRMAISSSLEMSAAAPRGEAVILPWRALRQTA
jgi:hypothetical protein